VLIFGKLLETVRLTLKKLKVAEIFSSVQGESTHAGKRCAFIRLTGCNLRCSYCDTAYAFHGGTEMTIDEIVKTVIAFDVPLVEITGGEPLMQKTTPDLAQALIEAGLTVMIETNGFYDVGVLPSEVIKIVDVKCPSCGEGDSFNFANLAKIDLKDELKFVIGNRDDYLWAKTFVQNHNPQCELIFSPSWEECTPRELTEWVIEDKLPVRIGIQLHKIIWDKETRGV